MDMNLLAFVCIATAVLVLGVATGKPWGWCAAALAIVAILAQLSGWPR